MQLVDRMIRAAKLDVNLYEEVEHDVALTTEAATVVVISNVLFGLGTAMIHFSLKGLVMGVIGSVVGWAVFAGLVFIIGTKLLDGKADWGEMLRVLGYASAPLCLGIIPVVGTIVGSIWALVAAVIAIRQGLDTTTGKAVVAAILSALAYIGIFTVLSWLL